jgi:LysR family transcriptional regulator, nod-box dependent transcriptional activator
MRFKGLDLNLLIALEALLVEQNVSAAARKLFLSQSAMSGALARLREHFQDALLVPLGRKMVLTAAAESLVAPVHQLMLQIESTVGSGVAFDPATSIRSFVVHASDYVTDVVLTRLVPGLAAEAPGVVLEIVPPLSEPGASLEAGEVDILITPQAYISKDHPAELLFEEDHVIVGWSGNVALSMPPSAETFFGLGHVVIQFPQSRAMPFAESEIAKLGFTRRVELIAPSFTSVPKLLVDTLRVSVMHRRLADRYARSLPLTIQPLPFAIPPLREMVQYHQVRSADAGIQWLKTRLLTIGRELS